MEIQMVHFIWKQNTVSCYEGNSHLFKPCGKQKLVYAGFKFLKIKDCKLNCKSMIFALVYHSLSNTSKNFILLFFHALD